LRTGVPTLEPPPLGAVARARRRWRERRRRPSRGRPRLAEPPTAAADDDLCASAESLW